MWAWNFLCYHVAVWHRTSYLDYILNPKNMGYLEYVPDSIINYARTIGKDQELMDT